MPQQNPVFDTPPPTDAASATPSTAPASGQKTVRAFDPASQQRMVRGRLHAFDVINARFSRHFRMSLFNLIRRSADITVQSVRIQRFADFTAALPVPANLNLIAIKPLRGTALVVFPPKLISLVVDSLFGGAGRLDSGAEGREFTPTEQRIIQRLLTLALDSYAHGWSPIHPIEPEQQRVESQIKFANITNTPNELVVSTTFQLEVGEFGALFHICMPYAMLEPIHDLLAEPLQKKDPEEQRYRAAQLADEVKQSRVRLAAEFTTVAITIGALRRLAVGDVLPIALPTLVTASVDGVPVFECDFGRLNARKALRVTRVIDHLPSTSPFQDHRSQDNHS